MTDESSKFTKSQSDKHLLLYYARQGCNGPTLYIVLYFIIRNSVNHLQTISIRYMVEELPNKHITYIRIVLAIIIYIAYIQLQL